MGSLWSRESSGAVPPGGAAGVVAAPVPAVAGPVHGPRGIRVRAPAFTDAAVAACLAAAATQDGMGRNLCPNRLLRLAAIMAAACGTATSEWDHIFALRDGPFTVRELLRWRAESYVARGAPSLSLWHSLDTLRGSPILLSFLRIFWSNLTRVAVPHFPRPLRTGPAVRAELSSSDARASRSGRSVAVGPETIVIEAAELRYHSATCVCAYEVL